MILDTLKSIGKNCPICNGRLNTVISISKRESGPYSSVNSCTYTLSNFSYPLIFTRSLPFGIAQETVEIRYDDTITFHEQIGWITMRTSCDTRDYKCTHFSDTQVDSHIFRLTKSMRFEEFAVEEFLIVTGHSTNIYKRENPKEKVYTYYNTPEKIISISNPVDVRKWPLTDKHKLKEKINKLLLLK